MRGAFVLWMDLLYWISFWIANKNQPTGAIVELEMRKTLTLIGFDLKKKALYT